MNVISVYRKGEGVGWGWGAGGGRGGGLSFQANTDFFYSKSTTVFFPPRNRSPTDFRNYGPSFLLPPVNSVHT